MGQRRCLGLGSVGQRRCLGLGSVGQRRCLGVRLIGSSAGGLGVFMIGSTPVFGGATAGGFQFGGHFVTGSVFMWILVKRG